ncbi:protein-tyrosine phosphatase [Cenarchaeum symbiosum A]|uniref:Protein-tyrosine phosphatase n=1 Tax=Cenarchaeum symbiosum (strain A) TaxID=414004 RepID=A0RX53_CENSY|nr:protein-tyrosine phosphatase [Cenarchaeum symbiosum A]
MSKPGNAWRKIHGRVTGQPTNFSWVIEGSLAGSGMPTTAGEFGWLLSQGVKSVVTMTQEALPGEWTNRVEYCHVPTPDMGSPGMEGIESAVSFIRGQIAAGNAAVVHCAAGMGRTGTILACYLVKHEGHSADEAITRIKKDRPGSIQSDVQMEAVAMYEKYLARGD